MILDGSNYLRPGGICIQNLEYINLSGFVLRHFANKQYSCRGGMDFGDSCAGLAAYQPLAMCAGWERNLSESAGNCELSQYIRHGPMYFFPE